MKRLFAFLAFAFSVVGGVAAADRGQSVLVRVTTYWRGEGSGQQAASNGMRLCNGHCAVDPHKIRFGSRIVFDDACLTAVDSGPDVVNRKAARQCARNKLERNALVIDRFFETKKQAVAWAATHPEFMTVRVIPPGTTVPRKPAQTRLAKEQAPAGAPTPKRTLALGSQQIATVAMAGIIH